MRLSGSLSDGARKSSGLNHDSPVRPFVNDRIRAVEQWKKPVPDSVEELMMTRTAAQLRCDRDSTRDTTHKLRVVSGNT